MKVILQHNRKLPYRLPFFAARCRKSSLMVCFKMQFQQAEGVTKLKQKYRKRLHKPKNGDSCVRLVGGSSPL